MFGPLAFEAVGQKQNDTAEAFPLVLRAGNELIDDGLGGIPKITELSLPENESIRIIEAEAVFESEDSSFGKGAVEDLDGSRIRVEMLQRYVSVTILIIVKDRMSLAE